MWWCQRWNIPPTDPRADAPLHVMEKWYILEGIENVAILREKPLADVTFEECFGFSEDMSDSPTTYAGWFDKLVREAGGMDACTSEQLSDFNRRAQAAAKSSQD